MARVVLIKFVLSSLPLYHLSYFKLSSQEAHKCDMVLSNFFWGTNDGKSSPHMKAWESVCRPKEMGRGDLELRECMSLIVLLLEDKPRELSTKE